MSQSYAARRGAERRGTVRPCRAACPSRYSVHNASGSRVTTPLSCVRVRVQSPLMSAWLTMDSDYELQLLLVASLYLVHKRKKGQRKSVWVQPIFIKRRQHGEYHQLLQEMRLSDPESHFRYLRMSVERFDMLLAKVRMLI